MRSTALIGLILMATAIPGHAQDTEGTIRSHGIGTFGEPALPADFDHLPYVNPDAPKGGEIAESIPNSTGFDNYNPFTFRGRAAVLSTVMLESILTGTADEVGAAYCLLCESIEYPESRDWVIFHLRPEAKFSDGTPLTADDVLFSYETLRTKGLSSFRVVIAQQVASATVIDDHTIRFDFTPDYPRRDVIQSVGRLPIFSAKDFEENDRDLEQPMQTPMIGSGPYVFGSADINRNITWKRDPDYWGADLPINRGRHNFDSIRFEYFADYDAAFEAFKAGEYTFRREVSSIIWATRYDFPALQKGWVVKQALPDGNISSGQAWVLNLRRPDWQDIRVREAIGLMFNFEWSNASLFYGLYDRVESFWDNSDLEAEGPPSEAELALLKPLADDLPEGVLTEDAVLPPVSGERQADRGNLRKAAALLDEAGWTVGSDGLRRNADGRVLSLEILNDSQTFDRVINPFVQNLRRLGIDARNTRVDNAEYENRKRGHDFDMISDHLGQDAIPGANLQQYFGSANVDDVFNSMGLANPAVDSLISTIEAADTQDELTTAAHALDRTLRALRFWVPQWYNGQHLIAHYDIFGRPDELPPFDLGELDFWWYDQAKADELRAAGGLR
ncbi:extracellular solute-binding protein [Paracoccus sp. 1_MG-2023]|uniref:extracellular solute-binding protein n=1 Tax=unclassified Paracoccus (in: a-proteobacteria) TaxID=2688777 RepID=UPI001C092E8A|nr:MULTISPECIES: extracellular solute-binding protein [unclassified Paracoccus (in: a-proteobacteria)]MBU2958415.1 extracellular solute-binding protein [Paracoccus sp. C2R09]MDO6668600.1 extracellular solute-binding protein [Paracoccus sp. 1_MG-2023]